MPPYAIVLIVVAVILIAVIVALYFLGKKAEKKKAEQDEQIASAAQTVTMLIIDKKKMRFKDAGLPAQVVASTPKMLRRSKVPIVKAKVGPKVMTLICDAAIFDTVPVKKEVKATVSGLYITGIRGLRGPIEVSGKKKKGFMAKLRAKANEMSETNAKKSK